MTTTYLATFRTDADYAERPIKAGKARPPAT
jgi:hypothetical protein